MSTDLRAFLIRMLARMGKFVVPAAVALALLLPASKAKPATPAATTPSVLTVGRAIAAPPIAPGFVGLSLEYWAVPAYAGPDPSAAQSRVRPADPKPGRRLRSGAANRRRHDRQLVVARARIEQARRGDLRPDSRLDRGHASAGPDARSAADPGDQPRGRQRRRGRHRGQERSWPGSGAGRSRRSSSATSPSSTGASCGASPARRDARRTTTSLTSSRTSRASPRRCRRSPWPGRPTARPAGSSCLGRFLSDQPRVAVATLHRYPLQQCFVAPEEPNYPTIAHLLAPTSSRALADSVIAAVKAAHAHHVPMRIDEMNTISCGNDPAVGDSFASALWALDALFEMARVGVDGVNIHTFPGVGTALFSFRRAARAVARHGGARVLRPRDVRPGRAPRVSAAQHFVLARRGVRAPGMGDARARRHDPGRGHQRRLPQPRPRHPRPGGDRRGKRDGRASPSAQPQRQRRGDARRPALRAGHDDRPARRSAPRPDRRPRAEATTRSASPREARRC